MIFSIISALLFKLNNYCVYCYPGFGHHISAYDLFVFRHIITRKYLKHYNYFRLARIPVHEKENPGYWHHFATTWSSSTGHWKVYLDGSLVSIVHNSASNITIPSGGPLYLGKDNYWSRGQNGVQAAVIGLHPIADSPPLCMYEVVCIIHVELNK